MRHPITEAERERGLVTLTVLPSQAKIIDEFLVDRGFQLGPPMIFEGHEDDEGEAVEPAEIGERFIVMTPDYAERMLAAPFGGSE